MKPIAVFDTNILISASGWKGKPFRCLEAARHGAIDGFTCEELLQEFRRILQTKLHYSDEQITDTIADLLTFLSLVRISHTIQEITSDPTDNIVLECAVAAQATHIITGDSRHLLPLKQYQGIAIVSASEFLASVLQP
jgi:putative PIN family toxin of toxin-antitoxin system